MEEIQQSLWRQFGASIDMLHLAIRQCPEAVYQSQKRFFYLAYHSVLFLDYYLTFPPADFSPQLPFSIHPPEKMPEEALGDILPDRQYTQIELLAYLEEIRERAYSLLTGLTEGSLARRFVEDLEEDAMDYSLLEILMYNLRHTQHHVGQLNLLLRQAGERAPKWVFRAGESSGE